MDSQSVERRWITLMNADVVGYSRLAAENEVAAMHALLRAMRWLSATVEDFGGHVLDATGDNLMAEFPREHDAVRCALCVQRWSEGWLSGNIAEMSVQFRIGIHSGTLLCRQSRRFGHAVNIAARLQALAPNGGMLVSEATYERMPRALQSTLTDYARLECRNIPEPVGTFRGLHV